MFAADNFKFNALAIVFAVFISFSCKTNLPGPFQFATLKDWTDEAFKWDEASERSAISISEFRNLLDKNKVALKELDKTLRIFALKFIKGPIAHKRNWLNKVMPNSAFYAIKTFGKNENSETDAEKTYYGQKILVPKDSLLVIMGDFHGSIHSLLRNLWRLHVSGYIDNDFKIIKGKTHFIFTGDFVDRGRYSAETLYTLLRLKLANFDRVHLVRGNHEIRSVSERYGLIDELMAKYGTEATRAFKDISDFYRFLPVVLFVGTVGRDESCFLHFSHGGFSYDAEKKQILHSPAKLIHAKKAPFFELIAYPYHLGYMWADFHQSEESEPNSSRGPRFKDPSMGVSMTGQDAIDAYFQSATSPGQKGLIGIFRGHQDQGFGFKMLFRQNPGSAKLDELALRNAIYPHGPFNWLDVIEDQNDIDDASLKGIRITPYRRVYTFTTASEGQGVPFDMYGILKTANTLDDYRLEIHEVPLLERPMGRSYVTISPKSSPKDDGIHVSWSKDGPGMVMMMP